MSGDTFTNALGLTQTQSAYTPQVDEAAQLFRAKAMGQNLIAPEQYKQMANQAAGATQAGIAQAKGMRPSGAATMADIAGSRMQGQAAQQAGILGLQEQQGAMSPLANLLMGQQAQDVALQKQQQENLTRTLQVAGAALA